jgi:ketosteroid isomerase-like protein
MSNVEIIRNYFKQFFSGKARHAAVRGLLTDDFSFGDPLMSARSADDYVAQLKAAGDELEMYVDVREVVGEGNIVAALVDFHGPSGKMTYAQWFTFRNGKISHLQVVYDPRPFLEMKSGK